MGLEFDGLYRAGVFGAVVDGSHVATKRHQRVSANWIYSWKVNEFGIVVRAKARLIARGFGKSAGLDFFETFPPCPSVASIRLLAAIACELGLDL